MSPRPREYADGSVQTGFRIQADVHEALLAAVEDRGVNRNKIVDRALRVELGLHGPKLRHPSPQRATDVTAGSRRTGKTRKAPRLARVGEEFRAQEDE